MTENELLDELVKEIQLETRLPGDVDPYMLSKATGLTRKRCSDILNEKAEKGLLLRIETRKDNGHSLFVYRKK